MSDAVVAAAEASIAKGSQSFAAAARLFAPSVRDDAVMLYTWCRHCDDVIDGQVGGHGQDAAWQTGQAERLSRLREQTEAAFASGGAVADPVFEAMRRVMQRHAIPVRHPRELLDGFAMDVEGRRYRTVGDLMVYCYGVAGVVGVMMARIMGVRDEAVLDRASDLGLAFQMTNIARDVIADARAGRVYLPDDLLARHDADPTRPDDRSTWPALHAAALDLLAEADRYYASARDGLAALPPRSAWAIAAALRVYRRIGERLRAGGPAAWETRVSTSAAAKAGLIARAALDVAASRRARVTPRPDLWQRP